MKTFKIKGATGESTLLIGEKLQHLTRYVPTDNAVIITDTNVWNAYQNHFPPWSVIKIAGGETEKTLDTAKYIYSELLSLEADRSSFIVGIGGGIVCDIAGFVASTYMRGLKFGFVSSTLLSQVDASVGGKNGVNVDGYKNIVGMFNQPEFVICDIDLLRTLPEKEILNGFGEIVKHAVIADPDLFTYIEDHYERALKLDTTVVERLVHDSIVIKSSIVNQDEKETGIRRKLNFGHTFGHAFEKITGVTHGEAVSAGMMIAIAFSEKRGLLPKTDLIRIENLLKKLGLPTSLSVNRHKVLDAIRKDKKRSGEEIYFVLLNGIGSAIVERIFMHELDKETFALLK